MPLQQIIDSQKEKSIGKLEFPLMQLLKSEDMTFEQPFPLKESGHNSTLTCRFTLKVCNTMKWRSTLGHSLFEQATLQWMLLLNGEYIKKNQACRDLHPVHCYTGAMLQPIELARLLVACTTETSGIKSPSVIRKTVLKSLFRPPLDYTAWPAS